MTSNRVAAAFAGGIVAGAALLGLARFVAMPAAHEAVHYHANWAVVIDGERLDLSGSRYMEDVAACSADPSQVRPEDRVHMHGNDHDAVHVHAAGVTWGHFLANIGFAVGDDWLVTDAGERLDGGDGRTIKFVLNGRQVPSIRNLPVRSEDRLLVSHGPETAEEAIRAQFPQVASTAARLNTLPDPASCSGPVELTTGERLRRAFWFESNR